MLRYIKRESLAEKGERLYEMDGEQLTETRPDGFGQAIAFAEVAAIRVAFAPTRMKPNRYLVTVSGKDRSAIRYDNMHFRGVGDFEDRSVAFSEFTRFLIERVSRAAPAARLYSGAPALSFAVQLAVGAGGLVLAATALIVAPLGTGTPSALVKGAILLILLPFFVRWMFRSRPAVHDMGKLPPDLLPVPMAPRRSE